MATPTVISTASTTYVVGRVLNVDMPTSVEEGDLLVVFAAVDNNSWLDFVALDGFSILDSGAAGADQAVDSHFLFSRIADGTEGGGTFRLVVGSSVTEVIAAVCYCIRGGREIEYAKQQVTLDYATYGGYTNPTLTPSWGSDDYLWLVSLGYLSTTSQPAGYGNYLTSGLFSSSGSSINTASKETTASTSETPGTWTSAIGGSQRQIAWTVAVRPYTATSGGVAAVHPLGGA